jgi:hypothetical protein
MINVTFYCEDWNQDKKKCSFFRKEQDEENCIFRKWTEDGASLCIHPAPKIQALTFEIMKQLEELDEEYYDISELLEPFVFKTEDENGIN